MRDAPPTQSSLRERVALAMWDAMVNDEPPTSETLDREGFLDAADAAIKVVREAEERDYIDDKCWAGVHDVCTGCACECHA